VATLLAAGEATANRGKEALTVAQWSPRVDITEDEKEYLIKAELPDMKKEDVRLTVEDDVLSISGDRKFEKEEKGRKYHRIERAYGSFARSFSLSEDADRSNVTADFKDGVLQVHLPKSVKAKQKAMEIKIC
jgi:HSP20 family protein